VAVEKCRPRENRLDLTLDSAQTEITSALNGTEENLAETERTPHVDNGGRTVFELEETACR
jgi:hypothetical protein